MPIIHLTLTRRDRLMPCPFCGGWDMELQNTHTACYWISCSCGVEVHGKAFGSSIPSPSLTRRHHVLAKKSAIDVWNRRSA